MSDDIDKRIAVEVMMWEEIKDFGYPSQEPHWYPKDIPCRMWHPSTNIEQAFEVVDKLTGESLWLSVSQMSGKHPQWRAVFTFGGMDVGDRTRGMAMDKSLPMAICLAALSIKKENRK